MTCQTCYSQRIMSVLGKCGDCFSASYGTHNTMNGYVPDALLIGSGDYIEFNVCVNCGQIQADFPISHDSIVKSFSEAS